MDRPEAQEFTESLGQVFSGGFRLIAHAHRQGVPRALGVTTPEWVQEHLGGYVKMAVGERREAVAELTENGMTNVAIADVLGVSRATVERDKTASFEVHEDENEVKQGDEPASFEVPEDENEVSEDEPFQTKMRSYRKSLAEAQKEYVGAFNSLGAIATEPEREQEFAKAEKIMSTAKLIRYVVTPERKP